MTWFLAVLVVLAIGGVAVVAAGHGATLGPAYADRPDVEVPADGPLGADDLRAVRFTTAVRGYRTDEIDALLERLAAQLEGQAGERRPEPAMDEEDGPSDAREDVTDR